MFSVLAFSLLALPLASAAPVARTASCAGTTAWDGGLYGPGGQTQLVASYPINVGEQLRVSVIDLATCTEVANPNQLVQFDAWIINEDTYDATSVSTVGGSVLTVVGSTPDDGSNLVCSVTAHFAGASEQILKNTRATTAVKFEVL